MPAPPGSGYREEMPPPPTNFDTSSYPGGRDMYEIDHYAVHRAPISRRATEEWIPKNYLEKGNFIYPFILTLYYNETYKIISDSCSKSHVISEPIQAISALQLFKCYTCSFDSVDYIYLVFHEF